MTFNISGKWLYELYKKYQDDLFSANPRNFLGYNSRKDNINLGIKDTAEKNAKNFWAFNNGLIALVHKYSTPEEIEEENKFSFEGIAIINGAQTTDAIGSMHKESSEDVLVLIRFIVCSDKETINYSIKYNNKQNEIQPSGLRSNDIIQSRLRSEFTKIPNATYDGGRRSAIKLKDLIPADAVAQALTAFHGKPILAYNDSANIWLDDMHYSFIFYQNLHEDHVLLVYVLKRAIEMKKMELKNKGTERLKIEKEELKFFRKRGAIILYIYAVSEVLEVFLDQKITNKFRIVFTEKVSPEEAIANWKKIIDITVPFVPKLIPALEGGLNNQETGQSVVSDFKPMVAAITVAQVDLKDAVKSKIKIG